MCPNASLVIPEASCNTNTIKNETWIQRLGAIHEGARIAWLAQSAPGPWRRPSLRVNSGPAPHFPSRVLTDGLPVCILAGLDRPLQSIALANNFALGIACHVRRGLA